MLNPNDIAPADDNNEDDMKKAEKAMTHLKQSVIDRHRPPKSTFFICRHRQRQYWICRLDATHIHTDWLSLFAHIMKDHGGHFVMPLGQDEILDRSLTSNFAAHLRDYTVDILVDPAVLAEKVLMKQPWRNKKLGGHRNACGLTDEQQRRQLKAIELHKKLPRFESDDEKKLKAKLDKTNASRLKTRKRHDEKK